MKKKILSVFLPFLLAGVLSGCFASTSGLMIDRYEKDVLDQKNTVLVTFDKLTPMSDGVCILTDDTLVNDAYVNADHAGVFSEDQIESLYAKDALSKIYPASMTKCMTALLVLESGLSMNDEVTVTDEAFFDMTSDASLAGLKSGWTYRVEDLLYGLLLPSGNEAANALGIAVSGSVQSFVNLMNVRAAELGMVNSHFMNPHGLHHDNHYTTVYDLYLLFRKLITFPEYLEIAGSTNRTITAKRDGVSESVHFSNTNSFLRGYTKAPDGITVLGGKTGYTYQAGRCLVLLSVNRRGERFITVIAHARSYDDLYLEMNKLLEIAAKG